MLTSHTLTHMAMRVAAKIGGLSLCLKWDVPPGLQGSILSVLWGCFYKYTYVMIMLT
jgi:hypothetical protein